MCGDALTIAESIRKSVREELGLTVSIGVSYNKIFAKLGSDMKKPDAITQIRREEVQDKIWPLDCSEMIYCGRATTAKLAKYGIHTIGQVAETDPSFLKHLLGVNGLALWRFANGTDTSRVMHKDFVSPVKSIGHGITCTADLDGEDEVWRVILELSQDIGHRLRVHELSARGVQVYVRGNDLLGSQFQCKLPFTTQLPSEIANAAFRVFRERYRWSSKVRAVTVRAIDLVPQTSPNQLSIFINAEKLDRRERLQDAIEELRGRFGKTAMQDTLTNCDAIDTELTALDEELSVIAGMMRKCIDENARSALDQGDYLERYSSLAKRHETTYAKYRALEAQREERLNQASQIGGFLFELMERVEPLEKFDDRLWLVTIDKVIAYPDGHLGFKFRNGMENMG